MDYQAIQASKDATEDRKFKAELLAKIDDLVARMSAVETAVTVKPVAKKVDKTDSKE